MRNAAVILGVVLCLGVCSGKYSGGDGDPNSVSGPYRISTAADLMELAASLEDYGAHFVLTNDIDMAGISFEPIGDWNTRFAGTFDGSGHVIHNLTVVPTFCSGLFGYVGWGGAISNLGVVDGDITGDDGITGVDCSGLLVGRNDGTIAGCWSSGTVKARSWVGGLAGWNAWRIVGCESAASVIGYFGCGGLVGRNDGTIENCNAGGGVSVNSHGGGLVGVVQPGGLVARCYATGAVNGVEDTGGCVGYNGGTITNCYSTGAVSADSYAGGFVGKNRGGGIANCYSIGSVQGSGYVGGLVGESIAPVAQSYYLQGSGPDNGAGTALTDAEMRQQTSFAGWDFAGESANGTEDIWMIAWGSDYPRLVVAEAPYIQVREKALFLVTLLDDVVLVEKTLSISNFGREQLEFDIACDCPWLEVEPLSGSLACSDSVEVSVRAKPEGLGAGVYECELVISDPAAVNSPQVVMVNLVVAGPRIEVSKTQLDSIIAPDNPQPAQQVFTIRNGGGGVVDFSVTAEGEWLSVAPSAGSSAGEAVEITVCADPAGLEMGVYEGEITIESPQAENSPVVIGVVMRLGSNLWVPYDYPTIQAAIDAAVEGEVITVAPGLYSENIRFRGQNIVVRSMAPKDEDCALRTVIQAAGRVATVTFSGREDADCQLAGVTVIGGFSVWMEGACVEGNGTRATIRDCFFRNGRSQNYSGGIMHCHGLIENCVVTNTRSGSWAGGAIISCNGTIRNCKIRGNYVSNYDGYSPVVWYCSGIIENCVISDNIGGGLGNCNGTIRNCTIVGNSEFGLSDCKGRIENCIIWGNSKALWSSALPWYSCYPGGSGNGNISAEPLFSDSGYWDPNTTPEDPSDDVFVRSYHLKSEAGRWDSVAGAWVYDDVTSPCIDAGQPEGHWSDPNTPDDPSDDRWVWTAAGNWHGEFWPHGGRINMGAYGGTREASMSLNPVGDAADLDYDDVVGLGDFGVMAREWGFGAGGVGGEEPPHFGEEEPPHFRAGAKPWIGDLDRDGIVGLGDLAVFAEEWVAE